MNLFQVNEIKVTYTGKELGPAIKTSADAYDILLNHWQDIDYCETFQILLLNRANKVLGISLISTGGLTATLVDIRKIFQVALKANAAGIILSHNHPSGSLVPSNQDIAITKKCKEAGTFLDIPVLDHLIITKNTYHSFTDSGGL